MSGCPACGRPPALARATCLYCGAALPEGSRAEALPARVAGQEALPPASPATERRLLGLRLEGSPADTLALALGLSAYDARQLAARGGDHLWRVLPAAEAEAEAQRLAQAGLVPWTLSESQVRGLAPRRAVAGRRDGATVCLRLAADDEGSNPQAQPRPERQADPEVRLAPGDLLLVVQGPIARESPVPAERRLVGMASPPAGYRVHLHLRAEARPLEVDPDDLELRGAGPASALLVLRGWLETLVVDGATDDGFRRLTPALAPAEREQGTGARWADSLNAATRDRRERLLLDNLAQFRFYSAWKALLARTRARPV